MTPRRTSIAAVTGGLALGALTLVAPAAQATEPTFAPSQLWTALDDVTRAQFAEARRTAEPAYDTQQSDSGQVMPLKKYEVGHLYGFADAVHTGGVHSGVDFSAPAGTTLYAIEGGKVVAAEWQGAAGKAVTIKTDSGHLVLYGHMNSMSVDRGDTVKKGDVIGRVGSTGNSTGPHLHLGVTRPNGNQMDPLVWMDLTAKELKKLSS